MKISMTTIVAIILVLQPIWNGCAPAPQDSLRQQKEEIATAFETAIREPSTSRQPERFQYLNPFLNYRKAEEFSKKFGVETIDFLKEQTASDDRRTARLAMLALAALGSEKRASDYLEEQAYNPYNQREDLRADAILAISFMPTEKARVVAESIVLKPGLLELRVEMLGLLRSIADTKTQNRLKRIDQKKEPKAFNESLKQTLESIEHRLNKIPKQQRQSWAIQELTYWQAYHDRPNTRDVSSGLSWIAEVLAKHGHRFSYEFLHMKLEEGHILAPVLLGMQKEKQAVPLLSRYAADHDSRGEACRTALAQIRTEEAVRALEELIRPEERVLSRETARLLINAGDKKSLSLLRLLAKDERFDEDSRKEFTFAAENLEKHLEKIQVAPPGNFIRK